MRRSISSLILCALFLGLGVISAGAVNVAALQKMIAQGAPITIIDVRTASAYASEHIPGAINIPAQICPLKNLPPLGQVVVYGDGLVKDEDSTAAKALAAKPGIQVDILAGGYAAWQSASGLTTRGAGLKPEKLNYITYDQLKTSKKSLVLLDLRRPRQAGAPALTDLNTEFPALKQVHSRAEVASLQSAPSLAVLIDDGDGSAEKEAKLMKLGGNHNYVILAGGELILSRHGQAGLQRIAAAIPVTGKPAPGGKK